jgi:hypothetical protein
MTIREFNRRLDAYMKKKGIRGGGYWRVPGAYRAEQERLARPCRVKKNDLWSKL